MKVSAWFVLLLLVTTIVSGCRAHQQHVLTLDELKQTNLFRSDSFAFTIEPIFFNNNVRERCDSASASQSGKRATVGWRVKGTTKSSAQALSQVVAKQTETKSKEPIKCVSRQNFWSIIIACLISVIVIRLLIRFFRL